MDYANYNQLYYFFKTAQAGSLTGAARELSITQPTLSIKIKTLERKLRLQLFKRGKNGVSLTPEGLRIFESCEKVFPLMEEALSHLTEKNASRNPAIRLGTSFSVVPEEILRIKRVLAQKIPGAALRIASYSWEDLKQKLERRQIDIAICDSDLTPEPSSLHIRRRLSRMPVYFVAAKSLKKKLPPFPQSLREGPLLLRAPGNPIRLQVEKFIKSLGASPKVHVEVEDPELIRAMALEGDGIVAINPLSIRQELAEKTLVKLHQRPVGIYSDAWLIALKNPAEGSRLSAAIEDCLKPVKNLKTLQEMPPKR